MIRWIVHTELDRFDPKHYPDMGYDDMDESDIDEESGFEISVMLKKDLPFQSYGWPSMDKLIVGTSDDHDWGDIRDLQHRAELIADAWNKAGVK